MRMRNKERPSKKISVVEGAIEGGQSIATEGAVEELVVATPGEDSPEEVVSREVAMTYRSSRLPYAKQMVLWSSQVFNVAGPAHTDE